MEHDRYHRRQQARSWSLTLSTVVSMLFDPLHISGQKGVWCWQVTCQTWRCAARTLALPLPVLRQTVLHSAHELHSSAVSAVCIFSVIWWKHPDACAVHCLTDVFDVVAMGYNSIRCWQLKASVLFSFDLVSAAWKRINSYLT